MKVLSLCGGIETGYLALKQLGIPVEEYHTFEISPPAIKVAQYHFPEIVHHGNVIGADFSQFKGFDMVIGGPCCQSLSITRADNSQLSNGLLGKSGIFYEVVRAIEEIQPKYFLVENVVPKSREDQDKMSALLGCEPIQINSSAFVPQDRVRLYWTNITRNPPRLNVICALWTLWSTTCLLGLVITTNSLMTGMGLTSASAPRFM